MSSALLPDGRPVGAFSEFGMTRPSDHVLKVLEPSEAFVILYPTPRSEGGVGRGARKTVGDMIAGGFGIQAIPPTRRGRWSRRVSRQPNAAGAVARRMRARFHRACSTCWRRAAGGGICRRTFRRAARCGRISTCGAMTARSIASMRRSPRRRSSTAGRPSRPKRGAQTAGNGL